MSPFHIMLCPHSISCCVPIPYHVLPVLVSYCVPPFHPVPYCVPPFHTFVSPYHTMCLHSIPLCPHTILCASASQLTWMCKRSCHYMNTTPGEEHVVSYLALSHVATQLLDIYTMLACAGTVWYAQPDAMKGSLYHTMKEVRPTIFLGVPRFVAMDMFCLF